PRPLAAGDASPDAHTPARPHALQLLKGAGRSRGGRGGGRRRQRRLVDADALAQRRHQRPSPLPLSQPLLQGAPPPLLPDTSSPTHSLPSSLPLPPSLS